MHRIRLAPAIVFLLLIASFVGAGCGSSDSGKSSSSKSTSSAKASDDADSDDGDCAKAPSRKPDTFDAPPPASAVDPAATYTATLTTSKGTMVIDLDPKTAPNAVANFVFLAREGYYDDVPFHRILSGFMVQTGDPTGSGTGGPGYTITDDKVTQDYKRGIVAMANTGQPNSAGAQFFIMHADYELAPTYSIFGKVTKGLDVLDAIAGVKVEASPSGEPSQPVCAVVLEKVEIDGPELQAK